MSRVSIRPFSAASRLLRRLFGIAVLPPVCLVLSLVACSQGSTVLQSPVAATATPGVAQTASPKPTAVPTKSPTPTPSPSPSAAAVQSDDWITFAHDYERTGFEKLNSSITPQTVSGLTLRWKVNVGYEVYDSPLVYDGNVVIATIDGNVFDFAAATGKLLWKRTVGGQLLATPSISDGLVFVGNRLANGASIPEPSFLFALRLLDGSVAWQAQLNGVTHGSPVVANGKVFIGTSGGDRPQCINGGVTALDESTGTQIWRWAVNPQAGGGGSAWGALSYDGTYLIFGTGNTCTTPIMTANGADALTTDGNLAWSFAANRNSSIDNDTGSGVMFSAGKAYFINKNGSFYSLDAANGRMLMNLPLGADAGSGGFSTPTTDGSTILEGAGFFATSSTTASSLHEFCRLPLATSRRTPQNEVYGYTSRLDAIGPSGSMLWSKTMQSSLDAYAAAIANGIAFVTLDNTLQALDMRSGASLWSYPTPQYFEASPVIVASGLYAADGAGNVYAFSIPQAAHAQANLRR